MWGRPPLTCSCTRASLGVCVLRCTLVLLCLRATAAQPSHPHLVPRRALLDNVDAAGAAAPDVAPAAAPVVTNIPGFTVTSQAPAPTPAEAEAEAAAAQAAAEAPVSPELLALGAGVEDGTLFLDGGRFETELSRALASGTAPPPPPQPARPLKLAIRVYNTANDSAAAEVAALLRSDVMPAVQSVLARSIAVRHTQQSLCFVTKMLHACKSVRQSAC